MSKHKKKKQLKPMYPVAVPMPRRKKPQRVINRSCRYYLLGTCTYSNSACNMRSIKCKLQMKPSTSLSGTGSYKRSSVSVSKPVPAKQEPIENYEITDLSGLLPDINIYGGRLLINEDDLELKIVYVSSLDKKRTYSILVTYNTKNDTYYISIETLKRYFRQGKLFYVNFWLVDSDECTETLLYDEDDFEAISLPAMHGYHVGKTSNLTDNERHELLKFLVVQKRCKALSLCNLMESNIRLRKKIKTYETAVQDWENDWHYIIAELFGLEKKLQQNEETSNDS